MSARDAWLLDPEVAFLNHGSFGACPRVVLDAAEATRRRLEREPVRFLVVELEALWDAARDRVAALLRAAAEDLVFVPNATAGANTVLRSLDLAPGDELLTTDHAYNACRQAMEEVAAARGARIVVAKVPFPLADAAEVTEAVLAAVTPRTRLCLLDQVTSPTALVFPVDAIVRALAERGVDTLVDAAHAPGMIPLDLDRTGAAYTTGNFHKWCCAPKSAAFLHVRRDRHASLRPLAVSHGRNARRAARSRFHLEHDWTGTFDPAPVLALPDALAFLEGLFPEEPGLTGWMRANHARALAARALLAAALGVLVPCPDAMVGAMGAIVLPDVPAFRAPAGELLDPAQEALFERHKIEVPIFGFGGRKILRVSTPAYVTDADIERLRAALAAEGAGGLPPC